MVKKAQAALEFLMTYGWAFMVILVMIGALAYFGVLNPREFLPEKCLFGAPLGTCEEFSAGTPLDHVIVWKLRNSFGRTVTITDIQFPSVKGYSGADCSVMNCSLWPQGSPPPPFTDCPAPAYTWADSALINFMFFCGSIGGPGLDPILNSGDFVTIHADIKYHTGNPSFVKQVSGEIQVKVP